MASRRLITVFGAGGDRDRTKRPLMGMVAARLSDVVVITSDNPRSEDPERIIDEVKRGADAGDAAERRRSADRSSIAATRSRTPSQRRAGDVVLIAGKGHEKYQEIGGRVMPFDDVAVAREALEARRDEVAGWVSALRLTLGWVAAAVGGRDALRRSGVRRSATSSPTVATLQARRSVRRAAGPAVRRARVRRRTSTRREGARRRRSVEREDAGCTRKERADRSRRRLKSATRRGAAGPGARGAGRGRRRK